MRLGKLRIDTGRIVYRSTRDTQGREFIGVQYDPQVMQRRQRMRDALKPTLPAEAVTSVGHDQHASTWSRLWTFLKATAVRIFWPRWM